MAWLRSRHSKPVPSMPSTCSAKNRRSFPPCSAGAERTSSPAWPAARVWAERRFCPIAWPVSSAASSTVTGEEITRFSWERSSGSTWRRARGHRSAFSGAATQGSRRAFRMCRRPRSSSRSGGREEEPLRNLSFSILDADGPARPAVFSLEGVVLAGYTGRDRRKALEHIAELQALGVAPPPQIPMFYPVDPALLTMDDRISVRRPETSGEVEAVLLVGPQDLFVGIGSDHTDRAHEAIDVAESKGMCRKPIGSHLWAFRDVEGHWDRLELRSWVTDGRGKRLYQEGSLAQILPPEALLAAMGAAGHETRGRAVFCGTVPAHGGIAYGRRIEAELVDPVLGRRLGRAYHVSEPAP